MRISIHKSSGGAPGGDLAAHIANTSNPHSVTKTQVGLGNVDNTSDANKPVSTAQQTALNLKSDATHDHAGVYEPAKGADDNFVTDAEKTKLANLSGTNTGDQVVPTTEDIQDIIGAMVSGNSETNITVTYDDTNGKLDFSVTGGSGLTQPQVLARSLGA